MLSNRSILEKAWLKVVAYVKNANIFNFRLPIDEINTVAQTIRHDIDHLVLIATGASLLNSRALLSSIHTYNLEVSVLDNLDTVRVHNVIRKIQNTRSAVFIISKSGNTKEVIELIEYVLPHIAGCDVYCITSKSNNYIYNLALTRSYRFIEYPDYVSGRFSIFAYPTLLTAATLGSDIRKIIVSAKVYFNYIMAHPDEILQYADWIIKNYEDLRRIMVLCYYSDQVLGLFEWARQLFSESLGKSGVGVTPFLMRGTIDEHSQLQLFLDGPDDKFYYIFLGKGESKLDLSMSGHARALHNVLHAKSCIYAEGNVDEMLIGQYSVGLMLVIILLAEYWGIDPFTQPMVNKFKELLGTS